MKSAGLLMLASAIGFGCASPVASDMEPIDLTQRGLDDITDLIRDGIDKAKDVVDIGATADFSLDQTFNDYTLFDG
jgi:hypothetical protein